MLGLLSQKVIRIKRYTLWCVYFIWKISSILKNIKKFMPAMYKGLEQIQSAIGTDEQQMVLEQEFNKMESQSIDYGIMERAKDIYILPGAFGWKCHYSKYS